MFCKKEEILVIATGGLNSVLKPLTDNIPDREREKICKKASDAAKGIVATEKRKISRDIRDDLKL